MEYRNSSIKTLIIHLSFFVALFTFNSVSGQGFDPAEQAAEITPPSATAYELGKYGQVPVGEFTGTPNVNIPLYVYQTRNLSVPISLSYNSNGIKVDQKETNVGLGWSLNAGGLITRIVRDKPDELSSLRFPQEEIEEVGLISPMVVDYLEEIGEGTADSETDLYMYNFNGYTGKFVFNKNNVPLFIPHNNFKVEVIREGAIQGFNLITPDGVKYEFTEVETSLSRMQIAGSNSPPSADANSTWHLTKIIHPYGDEIYFTYTGYIDKYITSQSQSFEVSSSVIMPSCPGGSSPYSMKIGEIASHELTIGGRALQSISSNVAKEGSVTINGTKQVSSIEIKDQSNNTLESFTFNYLTTANDRIFLKGVQFKDPQKKYAFDYIEPEDLVSRLSKSQDHWGYYNGATNNDHIFPNPKSLELTDGRLTYYDIGADKEPKEDFAKKGLLSKVTYPTKGYTQIEYEGNSYRGIKVQYPTESISESLFINTESGDGGTATETRVLQNIKFNQDVDIYKSVYFNSQTSDCNPNIFPTDHVNMVISIKDLTDPTSNNIFRKKTLAGNLRIGNTFLVSPDNDAGKIFMKLEANHDYEIELKVTKWCISANLGFTYFSGEKIEVQAEIPLGGLRVRSVADYNSATDETNKKVYYYGKKESKEISTAEKGVTPFYLSKRTNRVPCPPVSGNGFSNPCAHVDQEYIVLSSNSIRSLYNSISNSNTYYNYVTTSFGGENFEYGGIEKEFLINNDYPGNPILGEYIHSAPWTNFGWGNGLEKKQTVFRVDENVDENAPFTFITINQVENNYVKDDRHEEEVIAYATKKNFNLICPREVTYNCTADDVDKIIFFGRKCITDHTHIEVPRLFKPGNNCIVLATPFTLGAENVDITRQHPCFGKAVGHEIIRPDLLINLDITEYKTISHWFYLQSKIEKAYDENGQNPVISSTEYIYENPEHLQPTKQRTTNSDGKIYETLYKYYDEITNSTIKAWLQNNNIIEPWQTTNYVYQDANDTNPAEVDGTRFYYNNFGTSGNNLTYYPKTFQRYERTWDTGGDVTGTWQPEYTINEYETSVGKPKKITVDGWDDPTTYTWTTSGKLDTKTFKDFTTDYNYYPNTDLLSEIIEPDGQTTAFTYDDFMRLNLLESRDKNIKKDYNYSYNPNYIEEITTYADDDSDNDPTTNNEIKHTIKTTFDGLGRDIQIDQINHKWNSPTTDITIFKEYNNRGLLWKVYDPVDDLDTMEVAHTKYNYHPDPLGRIKSVKDPMTFETTSSFGTNAYQEVINYNDETGNVVNYYAANTLYKETVTDADDIENSTFTDKLGRVVMTMVKKGTESSKTYTNYDDKSRVKTIIPPGATIANTGLTYQYTYDGADNVTSTKIPDKGLMNYKYDARNLQTAMQDANLKANNKWLRSIYDAYGRLHQQGFSTTDNGSIGANLLLHNYYDNNDLQNTVNATTKIYKGKLHKTKVNILNGFNTGTDYITTTFTLDDYGRVINENITSNHIGLGESVDYIYNMADNILENKHTVGSTVTTENFVYDNKGRLTKNDFTLTGKGNKTIANYTSYSLKDEVLVKNMGKKTGTGYLQTLNYAYNNNGWLTSINGGTNDVIGTKNNCTAINSVSSSDLFALDLRYNDGTLAETTNRQNGNIAEMHWQVKDRAKNAYCFQYDYLNRITEAKHYTNTTYKGDYDTNYSYDERGNIMTLARAGMVDDGASCADKQQQIDNLAYMYEEGTNKLAKVFDNECNDGGLYINPINGTIYNAAYITSDAKTNILGDNINNTPIKFKADSYISLKGGFEYKTNGTGEFLATIDPCPQNDNLTNYGFKGAESSYRYDANGNLTRDSQKELNIFYNHLNLPYKAQKDANNKIEWLYTANGKKLQKKTTENGTSKTKNYLGNMEFVQSSIAPEDRTNANTYTLEAAYHSEGRVVNSGNIWEYNLKDHLGNVRIVFKDNNGNTEIVQENHYYPFGMQMNGNWAKTQTVKNDYLYNGKELNTDIGLNWSDYGARFYDSAVGRWNGVDPLAGKYAAISPYVYVANNPIIFIDPDGKDIVLAGKNNSSVTIKTDLIDISVSAGSLFGDIGGNYSFEGEDILVAGLDIVGVFDPTGAADVIAAGIEFNNGNILGGIASAAGVFPFVGDVGKVGKIPKHLKTINKAVDAVKAEKRAAKLSKLSREGKDFTKAGKEAVIDLNKAKNKGKVKCETCATNTIPATQSKKGVTPSKKERQVDHIDPKSKGGSGTPDNGQVLCRDCNIKKSNN